MNSSLRQHVTVMIAAALGVMIGSVGPGVAQAAYDAVNADKVDGKHAVGAGATVNQRKGKLVATYPTTGFLPNNIIKRAQDSARVNGYGHAALRSLPLSAQGAFTSGGAIPSHSGVSLSSSTDSSLTVGFIVPADHVSGAPLRVDMVFREFSPGACGAYLYVDGLHGPVDGTFYNGGWRILPLNGYDGLMQVPAGAADAHKQTFEWPFASVPGMLVEFSLTRAGAHVSDTCGSVLVSGLRLRY